MTIGQALFSFKGRMSRRDYWLKGFLVLLPFGIVSNYLYFGFDSGWERTVSIIISVISMWPGLALMIKRLHDRDRTGWWAATLFIPLLGIIFSIWITIQVWFLRGTIGSNRFGNDPVL